MSARWAPLLAPPPASALSLIQCVRRRNPMTGTGTGSDRPVPDSLLSSDGRSRIGVTRIGTGPRLLVMHSDLGGAEDWRPVTERLAPDFCVWLIERPRRALPVHPRPAAPVEVDDLREVVKAVADTAGQEAAVLGHGLGANIVLAALQHHPHLPVGKAILYEPTYHFPTTPGALEPSYRDLTTETLVMVGEDGPDRIYDTTIRIARLLPNATLGTIPGAGRTAHRTHPVSMAVKIRQFLDPARPSPGATA